MRKPHKLTWHSRHKRLLVSWLFVFSLLLSMTGKSIAQVTSSSSAALPASTSSHSRLILYHEFFRYVDFVDHLAEQQAKEGKDSAEIQTYLQHQTNLDPSEFEKVRLATRSTASQLLGIDSIAKSRADDYRRQVNALPNASANSVTKPSFSDLQAQHDAVLNAEIAWLQEELGSARFAVLDSYIAQRFSLGVTISGSSLKPAGIKSIPKPKVTQ